MTNFAQGVTATVAIVGLGGSALTWMFLRQESHFQEAHKERLGIQQEMVDNRKGLEQRIDKEATNRKDIYGLVEDLLKQTNAYTPPETCRFENDGECDALNHRRSTDLCPAGTDMKDCREIATVTPIRCRFENDGECDAIGYPISTHLCPAGTDQNDCIVTMKVLSDSGLVCAFENDGECDAMGYSVSTNLCPFGTDAEDCSGVANNLPSLDQRCRFEDDGQCDAAGYTPSTNRCPIGTDQEDCKNSVRSP